jgi:hypothetical protein
MKIWSVSHHSKKIYGAIATVRLYERPGWAIAFEHLVEFIDHDILRDNWCAPPDWAFKIGIGPKDEYDCQKINLGGFMYHTFQKAMWVGDQGREIACFDVDKEWLIEHGEYLDWLDHEDPSD